MITTSHCLSPRKGVGFGNGHYPIQEMDEDILKLLNNELQILVFV